MSRRLDRRQFLAQSAAVSAIASGYFINPSAAAESKSPNERLNLAAVGATGRAGANIQGCASQNIIAIADIDSDLLEKGSVPYPNARKYRDYRVMLEKEAQNIDAVLVGTPDHSHAPAAAMALRLGKHVYCEKPLTHTVKEARTLAELAKKNKLVTQMGTQIHAGDNYRRVVELVEKNAIGPIREVHVWANAVYTGGVFTTDKPCPPNLDWDLFLGPAPQRPYSDGVHPFAWRKFWDYGTGSLGDFGCHYMDLVHWALKLRNPVSVSADGPPLDAVSTPAWNIVEYQYPARGELPAVKLTWYDSGKQPPLLGILKNKEGKAFDWKSGQLFVGERGMILSDYGRNVLLPEDKFADYKRPEPYIPNSIGHHEEWLKAIKTGGETTCNFDYSGALTESVLLGTVAYRSGEKIEWDSENLKVKNSEKAQQLVHKEYRKGWTL
jgi:predicted dehydrogenase